MKQRGNRDSNGSERIELSLLRYLSIPIASMMILTSLIIIVPSTVVGVTSASEIYRGQAYTFSDSSSCYPASRMTGQGGGEWAIEASTAHNSADAYAYATQWYPYDLDTYSGEAGVWKLVKTIDAGIYHTSVMGHIKGDVSYDNGKDEAIIWYVVRVTDDASGETVCANPVMTLVPTITIADGGWSGWVDSDFTSKLDWAAQAGHTYRIGVYVSAYAHAYGRLLIVGVLPTPWYGEATANANGLGQWSTPGISYSRISVWTDSTLFQDFGDNLWGWTEDIRGGNVDCDQGVYVSAPSSYVLTKTVKAYCTSATHPFEGQSSGYVTVEANLRISSAVGYAAYLLVKGGTDIKAYLAVNSGYFQWFEKASNKYQTTGVAVSSNTWYHVVLSLDIANAKFDIYINGEFAKTGNFYDPSQTRYVDSVCLQAGSAGDSSIRTLWVDDLVVRKGRTLMCDELKDTTGWVVDASGGTAALTSGTYGLAAPSLFLTRNGAITTGGVSARFNFAPESKLLHVDARVRMDSSQTTAYAFLMLKDPSGAYCPVYTQWNQGQIYAYNGVGYQPTGVHFEYGKWYLVGIEVDLVGRTYDIYLDGAKMCHGAPFDSRAPTGCSIGIINFQAGWYGSYNNGALYVDDILVTGSQRQPPSAAFSTTTSLLAVSVDGSASSDPDGTISTYAWNWGDGAVTSASSTKTASHTYAADGTYTIQLTVTDNDGLTGTTTHIVKVTSVVPVYYTLTISTPPGCPTPKAGSMSVLAGSDVTVYACGGYSYRIYYYTFSHWKLDTTDWYSTASSVVVHMDKAHTITAVFVRSFL